MVVRVSSQHLRLPITSSVNRPSMGPLLTIVIDYELITFRQKLDLKWPQDTSKALKPFLRHAMAREWGDGYGMRVSFLPSCEKKWKSDNA